MIPLSSFSLENKSGQWLLDFVDPSTHPCEQHHHTVLAYDFTPESVSERIDIHFLAGGHAKFLGIRE
jgi:hypothetical protein